MHLRVPHRWSSLRTVGVIAVATVLFVVAPAADALATGGISGTVTDAHGAPLSGITVGGAAGSSEVVTDDAGHYAIVDVPPGAITVCFAGPYRLVTLLLAFENGPYLGQCRDVTVVDGVTTAGVDATMQVGGSITGTVTYSDGSRLRDYVASTGTGPSGPRGNPEGDKHYLFSGDGQLLLQGLNPGSYSVTLDSFAPSGCPITREPVQVTLGQATHMDFTLPVGQITGTITDRTGRPVSNATASTVAIPGGPCSLGPAGYAQSDAEGRYTMPTIGAGTYSVTFNGSGTGTAVVSPVEVRENATTSGVDGRLDGSLTPTPTPTPPLPSNAFKITGRTLKRGQLVVGLSVPGAGVIKATGTITYQGHSRYQHHKLGLSGARRVTTRRVDTNLRLKPNSAVIRLLHRGKKLKARVRLTFSPRGGKAATRITTITIKRR